MKTPIGIPRIAPTRKPQATDPASQPIRIPITITAAVVPIRTEPAPARLRFGVGVGSIGGASIAELVTAEMRLVSRKSGDFVRWDDGTSGPRPRLGPERRETCARKRGRSRRPPCGHSYGRGRGRCSPPRTAKLEPLTVIAPPAAARPTGAARPQARGGDRAGTGADSSTLRSPAPRQRK